MGLVFLDGFESYGTEGVAEDELTPRLRQHYSIAEMEDATLVQGRGGGLALFCDRDTGNLIYPIDELSELILGVAFYPEWNCFGAAITFWYGLDQHFKCEFLQSGEIVFSGVSPDPGPSEPCVWFNRWNYLEIRVRIGSGDGEMEVRCNGKQVKSATGVTIQTGSIPYINNVSLHGGRPWRFDDFYLLDPNSPGLNDFLGPITVQGLKPTGDVQTDFQPSSGVDHYPLVDHLDTVDFVSEDTSGEKDLWNYEDTKQLDAIKGVKIISQACSSNTSCHQFAALCKSGASLESLVSVGVVAPASGSGWTVTLPKSHFDLLETNPDTGMLWTPSQIDAAQFGVEYK